MKEFRISGSQLQQYTQGPGQLATDGERVSRQAEAKTRLHEMARDLIGSSGQIKSGYLRLKTHEQDQVSVATNRWQRSRQTDTATQLVRLLVKDAYGQNDQVEAALNAYLSSGAKNNKLGTRSFVKLVAELDRATTGSVPDPLLAGALQGRTGSLQTDLFAASFRLQQHRGQALALRERLGPLMEPGVSRQERQERQHLAEELIALRTALHSDRPQLSDKTLRQSSAMLMLEVEQNIKELLQLHCQDLSLAMDQAANYQVGRDGNAIKAMQSLQAMRGEMASLHKLQDQTQYPIMSLAQLDALGRRAEQLHRQFVDAQATRQRAPNEALIKAGVPTRMIGAQVIEEGKAELRELHNDRRHGLLASYAQARSAAQAGQEPESGITQAQARWDPQTVAIEAHAQGLISQIEQYHDQMVTQLDQACESLRQDMGDEASVGRFEMARTALTQGLANDRDQLKLDVQKLSQDRLGAPQAALAEHLARGQWADAALLLATQTPIPTPTDLAELARALELHAQPDKLARFMKAVVPADARSRIDFLTEALPRGDQASAASAPYLVCLETLEQTEPGSRMPLLGALTRSAGQHNPGTENLKGSADGQMLRLDDDKKPQRLTSARRGLISVASPQVNLKGTDLREALVHIEYRQKHNRQAWAPSLAGARLDQARIELDFSDFPRRIGKTTGATELDYDTRKELVSLFGLSNDLESWANEVSTEYLIDHPESEELPDEVIAKIEAGPPVRDGLHSILGSISTEYPQQRKAVACQLLDLAMQVKSSVMEEEQLLKRSPLFASIRQDPALMADPDITLRLDALSTETQKRNIARQELAQRASQPA